MTYQILNGSFRQKYDQLVTHPLQSWQWGEFRQSTGVEVVRVGLFEKEKLTSAFQLTFHKIPFTNFTVGYFPKGPAPTKDVLAALTEIGKKHNAIFIKLEPNVVRSSQLAVGSFQNLVASPKPIFTKYTFYIDLTLSEEKLLQRMESKTRYNIRVAQKHGVTIQEENTPEAFKRYLELTAETTKRQGFFAHTKEYLQLMWETFSAQGGPTSGGQPIAHLLTARYQGKILVTWILFLYNNVLYYPYGASSTEHKNVMASNLMMWETMRWGKKMDALLFDLWGTPGPDPKPTDDYYGFHRFKLGYGPKLVEFVGTYDLVIKQPHYILFTFVDKFRWFYLKQKAKFSF